MARTKKTADKESKTVKQAESKTTKKETQMSEEEKIAADAAKENELVEQAQQNLENAKKPLKDQEEKSSKSERQFAEIQELRGDVKVMENEGEFVEGMLTLKTGRTIGKEDSHQIETLELFQPETGGLILLPYTAVLKSKIDALLKSKGEDYHYVRVTYKGKKEGKENTYKDYALAYTEATQDDLDALANFEAQNA